MNKLKALRIEHQKTQQDIANFLNVTQKAVSFYELGQRDIPNETLTKLADYFHVTTDYLLGREVLLPELTDKAKEMGVLPAEETKAGYYYIDEETARIANDPAVQKFLRLSPDGRAKVEEYMEYVEAKEAETLVKSGSMQAGGNCAG